MDKVCPALVSRPYLACTVCQRGVLCRAASWCALQKSFNFAQCSHPNLSDLAHQLCPHASFCRGSTLSCLLMRPPQSQAPRKTGKSFASCATSSAAASSACRALTSALRMARWTGRCTVRPRSFAATLMRSCSAAFALLGSPFRRAVCTPHASELRLLHYAHSEGCSSACIVAGARSSTIVQSRYMKATALSSQCARLR